MFKEALELIQGTAQRAAGAEILQIPGDGRSCYVRFGDEIKRFVVEAKPRGHLVDSLDDLIEFVAWYCHRLEPSDCTVWHSRDGVTAVLDESDRRDHCTFPLEFSDEWKTVSDLGAWLDQRQFIRLLSVPLAGALDDPGLISKFRQLDWSMQQEAKGVVQRGKESLGKSIAAQVTAAVDLPEEIDLYVPVYTNRGERDRHRVRCALDIDPHKQVLQLVPMPNELHTIVEEAQDSIRSRLVAASKRQTAVGDDESPLFSVFSGKPL